MKQLYVLISIICCHLTAFGQDINLANRSPQITGLDGGYFSGSTPTNIRAVFNLTITWKHSAPLPQISIPFSIL